MQTIYCLNLGKQNSRLGDISAVAPPSNSDHQGDYDICRGCLFPFSSPASRHLFSLFWIFLVHEYGSEVLTSKQLSDWNAMVTYSL